MIFSVFFKDFLIFVLLSKTPYILGRREYNIVLVITCGDNLLQKRFECKMCLG